ncbi:Ribonuclease P protein subunit p25 [Lemmus lemmus]
MQGVAEPPAWAQGQTPDDPAASLSVLKNVPSLAILLSKDALDPLQLGYQPPNLNLGPSSPPTVSTSKRSWGNLLLEKAPLSGLSLSQGLRMSTRLPENSRL